MGDLINEFNAEDDLFTDEDLDWEQRQWNLEAEELNDCDEEDVNHEVEEHGTDKNKTE